MSAAYDILRGQLQEELASLNDKETSKLQKKISQASEAAKALYKTLEKAGIHIWTEKRALPPGGKVIGVHKLKTLTTVVAGRNDTATIAHARSVVPY